MTIVVADNRPDLYMPSFFCHISYTYMYIQIYYRKQKIRYKWLFGKEKSNRFFRNRQKSLEGSPNSECGMIYKKGVKKAFYENKDDR